MQWTNDPSDSMSVDYSFRRAKVEHYIEQAEERLAMSRYRPSLEVLQKALKLEPQDKKALALKKDIESAQASLHAVARGLSNGHRSTKRGEIVLVVDQDERVLTSVSESLARYGFKGVGASSFSEAIAVLSDVQPHVIVSEVNFADGPIGFDLYFWVRNNATYMYTPFLFLATRVTREMMIAGKRMGVDDFVIKPLDEDVLMASLTHSLSRRRKHVSV